MRYSNVYWTELNWTDLVGRSLSFTQTTFRRHILGWKLYVLRHVIRPLLSDNCRRLLGCWPCCSRTSGALEHTQSADKLTFNIHSEHIFSTTGYRLQSTNACTAVTALSLLYPSLLRLYISLSVSVKQTFLRHPPLHRADGRRHGITGGRRDELVVVIFTAVSRCKSPRHDN